MYKIVFTPSELTIQAFYGYSSLYFVIGLELWKIVAKMVFLVSSNYINKDNIIWYNYNQFVDSLLLSLVWLRPCT